MNEVTTDAHPVVVPGVDTGDDTLIDLFARVQQVADAMSPAEIACETGLLPAGFDACSLAAHALARAQLICRRKGSRLLLVGSSPELREVIALLGFDEILPEYRCACPDCSRAA